MRTRDWKHLITKKLEDYDEAMDLKFNNEFRDFIKPMLADNDIITYDDVQGFIDSFEQSDENEWAESEVQSIYEGYMDAKYEESKDERMGL